jgi:hypothetical protein
MASVKFTVPGRYAKGIEKWQEDLAKATTGAFRDGAKLLEAQTRSAIEAAGLGSKFARQFKGFAYPRRQFSLSPTIRGFHARGWRGSQIGRYANLFARGGTIRGKPLLWIPTPSAPLKIAGQPTTPRSYIANVGPLVSFKGRKHPILAGQSLRAVEGRRATVGQLKTGARNAQARSSGGKGRQTVAVPMFIGVPSVTIPKRVDMNQIFNRVSQELPKFFEQRSSR